MLGADSDTVTVYWDMPPSPPEAVTIKRNGRFIMLEWNSPATLENGAPFAESKSFDIYRSTQQGVFEEPPLNPEPLMETTYEDQPDTLDQTYFYTVRAVRKVFDTFIEGAPSAEVSLLFDDITPPGAPQALTAIPAKEGIILKWMAKAELGVAGFHVYRKDPAGKEFVRVSRELIQENSWIDRTARIGQRYTYAVKTVDQSLRKNESAFSEPVTVLHLPQ
jgi:fibronectin type 3 domain-containing protein